MRIHNLCTTDSVKKKSCHTEKHTKQTHVAKLKREIQDMEYFYLQS
jgi:hypothetical protein